MAVPDFQTLMLPLLRLAGDGAPDRLLRASVACADILESIIGSANPE